MLSRGTRNRQMRLLIALVLAILPLSATYGASDGPISVALGVEGVHARAVDVIKDRFGLKELTTKKPSDQEGRMTAFIFAADPKARLPEILVTIGVQALILSKTKRVPYIAISFNAMPRLVLRSADQDRLLAFCNQWNQSPFPVRLSVVDGQLASISVIVVEEGVTLTAVQLQREFVRVLQSIPRILLELHRSRLL